MERTVFSFMLIQSYLIVFGKEIPINYTSPGLKDVLTNVSLPNLNGTIMNDNDSAATILRYGFHETHGCQDFYKAYLCVKYCLENGYQIAKSDKSCVCKCYKNQAKLNFLGTQNTTIYPVPTTKKPLWAGNQKLKISGGEIIDTSMETTAEEMEINTESADSTGQGDNIEGEEASGEYDVALGEKDDLAEGSGDEGSGEGGTDEENGEAAKGEEADGEAAEEEAAEGDAAEGEAAEEEAAEGEAAEGEAAEGEAAEGEEAAEDAPDE